MEQKTTNKKSLTGVVVSDKMDKTVTIKIETLVKHPLYPKYIKRTNKVHVHDEKNEAHVGDTITVVESRPLSKTKRWILQSIIERAK